MKVMLLSKDAEKICTTDASEGYRLAGKQIISLQVPDVQPINGQISLRIDRNKSGRKKKKPGSTIHQRW